MPTVYLSPSTQEYNPYVDGGNEEYYMNLIADDMVPILERAGITVVRNDPEGNVSNSIADSNSANRDFHFAIHSNAAPPANAGNVQGADFYYYTDSSRGREYAEILAENYKKIYTGKIQVLPTTTLAELKRTRAPAVLVEVGYHDNPAEAQWIRENISAIAQNFADSIIQILK